jgi:protein-S-isoprenylcysteine O-methyltransferase Ste14
MTGLVRALLILPGTVLVLVPALLVWSTSATTFAADPAGPANWRFWLGLGAGAAGLSLMMATVTMFVRIGRGTPAPWDPPKRLVVHGVYRRLRNPMIGGVMLVLSAEALLLGSPAIALWLVVFVAVNLVYIPLKEEPELERRFGNDYRLYKANVPRWIPRWSAWREVERAEGRAPPAP